MTMITFTGLTVTFDNSDNAVSVGPTRISLIVDSAASTFSYSITDSSESLPWVDIVGDPIQVQLDGQRIDTGANSNFEVSIGRVTSPAGTTVVLDLWLDRGSDSVDFFFALDGADLPAITTLAQWNAFEASITSVGQATGAFAPGQNILWSTFNGATLTEDDEYIGTLGRDVFDGGIGDDYFASSRGNDVYRGGAGADQVTFRGDPTGVTANLATGVATDGWGHTDRLISIEMLRGSMFDDTFIGKVGTQIFRGIAGDDFINGGKGFDQVRYDRDANYGGTSGGSVHLGKGTATDGFGDTDTLRSIENARGSDFNDVLIGSGGRNVLQGEDGNDRLSGLNGNDTLDGGRGRDVLIGGAGDDILTGGAQADKFVFAGAFGNDTITDFQANIKPEKINLAGVDSIRSFADLRSNHLSNVNGTAVIDDGMGNTITLQGLVKADLSADDFLF